MSYNIDILQCISVRQYLSASVCKGRDRDQFNLTVMSLKTESSQRYSVAAVDGIVKFQKSYLVVDVLMGKCTETKLY